MSQEEIQNQPQQMEETKQEKPNEEVLILTIEEAQELMNQLNETKKQVDRVNEQLDKTNEELKKSKFYRGMGHADKFLIYNESNDGEIEKLHAINGSFSNEKVQEIIKKIKEKY